MLGSAEYVFVGSPFARMSHVVSCIPWFSAEMFSAEMFSAEMFSAEMFSAEMFSAEMFSAEMFLGRDVDRIADDERCACGPGARLAARRVEGDDVGG